MTINLSAPILIDTCVLMDDPMVLVRLTEQGRAVFLTITILNELENNKTGEMTINANSRKIYHELTNGSITALTQLPDGQALKLDDRVTRFNFRGCPVFVLHRSQFKAGHNDDRIMELAISYGLPLLTRDNAFLVRAKASGVSVDYWSGPGCEYKLRAQKNYSNSKPSMEENIGESGITSLIQTIEATKRNAERNQEPTWHTSNGKVDHGSISLWEATKAVGEIVGTLYVVFKGR